MIIRPIKDNESSYLYDFTKTAFSTAFVSDGNEQDYASSCRQSDNYIKELEYVAEENGVIVGDVMLSKFKVDNLNALLLNIVCVDVNFRNRGLGSSLIGVALFKATELGYDSVFLAGDPKLYSRLGFKPTVDFNLKNINGYDDRYILCKELKQGALANAQGTFDFAI